MQLSEPPNLSILLGDEFLIHRRNFNVKIELWEKKVGRESLENAAVVGKFNVECCRLILPIDLIKVEQARVLSLALVRKCDRVAL